MPGGQKPESRFARRTAPSLRPATALNADADNHFTGHTSPAYANMVGHAGGITAATLLESAICLHPARLGEPLALTVKYAGPVSVGAFRLHTVPVRTNKSTQHWRVDLEQGSAIAATATAVFAARRETWSATEIRVPRGRARRGAGEPVPRSRGLVPSIRDALHRRRHAGLPRGATRRRQRRTTTTSALWVRDEPRSVLDFRLGRDLRRVHPARIFLRRQRPTPAGTVSMTIYFHAGAAQLAAQGHQPVLGRARAQRTFARATLTRRPVWSTDRHLLATTQRVVYKMSEPPVIGYSGTTGRKESQQALVRPPGVANGRCRHRTTRAWLP
ncbi:MAG: thioesterase family protein [Ideonella sp.]|nr:thioesterase family protein [Ideonella sp.]